MTLPRSTSITRVAPDAVRVDVHLDPDYGGFSGHFPGDPFLPAMCQILIVVHALAEALGRPDLRLVEVRRARFVRPVRPGDDLRMDLRIRDVAGGAVAVEASHRCEPHRVADIALVLAGAAPQDPQ